MAKPPTKENQIIDMRLPAYLSLQTDWEKWRACYKGGTEFRDVYLEMFSNREDVNDFATRKSLSPIPAFAKSAIQDIRNSIFQRMVDIERRDGSPAYANAVDGDDMGVDRRGSTMNAFIGRKVLDELLVMGKVGVFVDAPEVSEMQTMADLENFRPYLYLYKVEDILSYSQTSPENPSEFQSILLRDTVMEYDSDFSLPTEEVIRYRHLWINEDGFVNCQFYNADNELISRDGTEGGGPTTLALRKIPFVLLDINESMMQDVCEYQIAILNLASSDVNYALQANFPFYTEQRDLRKSGGHLKNAANPDGTATAGGQGASGTEITTGVTQGRAYDKDMQRPDFIHPSSEPLKASMELQSSFEKAIRKLVNLAVVTLGRQSADAKQIDNQGLANGLSFIALALEAAEKQIAQHWAAYEEKEPKRRKAARVKYPENYSQKSEADRIDESKSMTEVISKTPSRTAKKELWKINIEKLLGGHVKPETLAKIAKEIDASKFTTSDPDTIQMAVENGLCGEKTGSMALGFDSEEHQQAREDHTARIKRIADAQGVDKAPMGSSARGVVDLDDAPSKSGADEKAVSRDNTFDEDNSDKTRGKGKKVKNGD